MTIDERLQFLLQSTESLHSTVQELTGNMHELTGNMHELAGGFQSLIVSAQRHDTQIAELIRVAQIDGENIRGLANIAERHEERLDALDGGTEE